MSPLRTAVVAALLIATASAICTVAKDCHGHATAVSEPTPGNCDCTCRNEWDGSQCQECPLKFDMGNDCSGCAEGYGGTPPNCVETCALGFGDKSKYCVYAIAANTLANGTCDCTCYPHAAWYGPRCDQCPPNFDSVCTACDPLYQIHNKQCFIKCTNAANCSGNAATITGDSFTGCTCNCDNKWFGGDCGSCPANISTAANCAACIDGYGGFPNCSRKCTPAIDCVGANTVEATGTELTGCTCNCKNKWIGDKCETCPTRFNAADKCASCAIGHSGFPICSRQCTEAADCSDHASSVSGTELTGCTCVCRNKWFGGNCSQCPVGFDAHATCSTCLPGRGGPTCELACDVADDCNNHATSATGFGTNCTCFCRNGWRGDTCDSCTSPYNGTDCQHCVPDFQGIPPDCRKICNVDVDCNSHATSTEGFLNGTCKCNCRNSWSGSTCDTCTPRYNASYDCGACNDGYEHYPNCSFICLVTANCSGNAVNVSGNTDTGCDCTCRNQWTGPTCSFCPPQYDSTKDCTQCAPGYEGTYPNCSAQCTQVDCSFHAANISGVTGKCNCTCRNGWDTSDCSVCPSNFNQAPDCDSCSAGYEDFPGCYLTCTIPDNCTSQATAVSGNTDTGCNCTCRNSWFGTACDQCPPLMNATKDCGDCIDTHEDYPHCFQSCTSAANCTDHAASVTGNYNGTCQCTCRNEWKGEVCDQCNTLLYNASEDCGTCITGLREYPKCLRDCDTTLDCNGHATNVSGDSYHGCHCTCRNEWSGANCSVCEPIYQQGVDCGACADGFRGYPECPRICTNDIDCSSHADSVAGTVPNCTCDCRWGWEGANCSFCPIEYNATLDCHECSNDYEGVFPNCYLKCTKAANCSGHADSVTGNSHIGCTCDCRNSWSNATCADCAERYEEPEDCGKCAPGYAGYPACPRVCDVRTECSNHALSVSGDYPNCTCNCSNHWTGDECNQCPPGFDPLANCGACAPGFQHYPNCTPVCDIVANCSNHASSVSGNEIDGCNCSCRGAWEGETCDVCPPNVNEAQDCGICNPGFGAFPACRPICTNADCTNRSLHVQGVRPDCVCDCLNGYAGNCSWCPSNFNATDDCASCMPGFVKYPDCWRVCEITKDCSNHATNVSGDTGPPGCNCSCRNHWNGTDCSECPINYDAANDCTGCADGYVDYPFCHRVCTNDTDCNGNAAAVSDVYPNCTCECRNQWSGDNCSVCTSNYDETKDCGACAWRHDDYPNCTYVFTPTLNSTATGTLAITITENASETATAPHGQLSTSPSGTENYTLTITASPPEATESLRLCDYQQDCNGHASSAKTVADIPTDRCSCDCLDSWISAAYPTSPRKLLPSIPDAHLGCGLCPHEYGPGNVTLPDNSTRESDCAGCAWATTPELSEYPICRFGQYVVGTWTLEDCSAPAARTLAYLEAVAQDLEDAMLHYVSGFGNTSSLIAPSFGADTGCPFPLPFNQSFPDLGLRAAPSPQHSVAMDLLRVRVVSVRNKQVQIEPPKNHRVLTFEVHIAGNNYYAVDRHAKCVSFALTNDTGAIGTAWFPSATAVTRRAIRKTPVMPGTWQLRNVEALLNASGPVPPECILANNSFLSAPQPDSVCKNGCPAPFIDEPTETDLWFLWIIAGVVVLAALIAAAVFLWRRFGIGARIMSLPFFTDPAKNTLAFQLAEDDEELRKFTKTRDLAQDDDFDDL